IVLILDEVQAGFARSGKMFAFEHAGIEPDVVVMSKAVGGSLPLAVLAIKRKFDAWQPAGHTGTFRGNQLAMGTGLATLNTIKNEKLADNATAQGEFLQAELKKLQAELPCIGHVRGCGLMLGIEIIDERQQPDRLGAYPADSQLAAEIQRACFDNKLLLEKGGRGGTVIRLLCPLIITREECEEVIVRFRQAVKDALVYVRGA
ncbi:MAG: aminotransferase class III-fold pyridoxal phosphate-dependent enzyme, partial [Acinetobacter sp.]